MINFYYKTIRDVFEYNKLPYFNIDEIVEIIPQIQYESDGSRMGNWFSDLLEYTSLLKRDMFFIKFHDGGDSSYSKFEIENYKINSEELKNDVINYKKNDKSVFTLQYVDDEIDIIICNREDSQELIKIVNVVQIISNIDLNFKKL